MKTSRNDTISTRRFRAIAFLAAGQLLAVGAMAAVISIADDDAAPDQPADARAVTSAVGSRDLPAK